MNVRLAEILYLSSGGGPQKADYSLYTRDLFSGGWGEAVRSTVLKCLLLYILVRKCLKTTETDKNEKGD